MSPTALMLSASPNNRFQRANLDIGADAEQLVQQAHHRQVDALPLAFEDVDGDGLARMQVEATCQPAGQQQPVLWGQNDREISSDQAAQYRVRRQPGRSKPTRLSASSGRIGLSAISVTRVTFSRTVRLGIRL